MDSAGCRTRQWWDDIVRELRSIGFAEQHPPGGAQPLDANRVLLRHIVLVQLGTKRGPQTTRINIIFAQKRHPLERTRRLVGRKALIDRIGLFEHPIVKGANGVD